MLALKCELIGAQTVPDGFVLHTNEMDLHSRIVVNSAGLRARASPGASRASTHGLCPRVLRQGQLLFAHPARRFRAQVYPVPEPGGLGVHVTLDLAGRRASGPMSNGSSASTTASIHGAPSASTRRSAATGPGCPTARLRRGTRASGRRPPVRASPRPTSRCRVRAHRVPGLVNLFGIESPGLTASLALAAMVLEELG